jgi:hypothetical protein
LFSRFVFHITGVVVMVMVLTSFRGILINGASKSAMELKTNYSSEFRSDCMSDIEISIGHIGDDVVALCYDEEASYAFYAEFIPEKTIYVTRMSSSHGLVTTGRFNTSINARQMVMVAMSKHIDVFNQATEKAEKAEQSAAVIASADRSKVH